MEIQKWYEGTIRKILSNEKYKGDALLQKTYTVDFLTKKRAENNREVPQYYVEDSHPAINKDTWEAVQLEIDRRKKFCEEHGINKLYTSTADNPFSGRIICAKCGRAYGRNVWNSTDEGLRMVIWRCNEKYTEKGRVGCDNRHIDDEVFYKAFIKAYNSVVENKEHFMAKWEEQLESDDVLIRVTAKRFIGIFKEAAMIDEFDTKLFFKLVEKTVVSDEVLLIVSLLDGTEIEIKRG